MPALFLLLIAAACVLTTHLLPRWRGQERAPGSSLLLWQAISIAAILAGVLLAPVAVLGVVRDGPDLPDPAAHLPLLLVAIVVSGVLLGRLAVRGHRVGTALRTSRRRHRELIDLLAVDPGGEPLPDVRRWRALGSGPRSLTVLAHATPTAYCVPGLSSRVVVSDTVGKQLGPVGLQAVLAHEVTHLRQRHDLILEFFTVLHTAVPAGFRSDRGLSDGRLLVEILADRGAEHLVGRTPVARAIVLLADAPHPEGAMGSGGASAVARLERLADARSYTAQALLVGVVSGLLIALPLVVTGWALVRG
ncbi:M56 family metallopeptidase [Branchiibius hedensis]|uniref:M56 family metallopeptidase n=1 Tax=Branchiibius hedensis TaxID=672460 RepID=UPI0014760F48|nr:M56 family metallopeptidase [Branchiibius hedensis]